MSLVKLAGTVSLFYLLYNELKLPTETTLFPKLSHVPIYLAEVIG